jgi:hypothetical protein
MSKLISLGVWVKDGTQYASASTQAYNSDTILFATNASTKEKQSYPAASGSINSIVTLNYNTNNSGERHSLYVSDSVATIVTGSGS